MVKLISPTAKENLKSAIRRDSIQLKRNCAVICIDQDAIVQDEIDIISYCAQTCKIPVFLIYIDLGVGAGAGSEVTAEMVPHNAVPAGIIRAAGKRKRFYRKNRPSCFGDAKPLGNAAPLTNFEIFRSPLYQILEQADIQTLIITGRARAACVKQTSIHAAQVGFKVLTGQPVVVGAPAPDESWMDHHNVEWHSP